MTSDHPGTDTGDAATTRGDRDLPAGSTGREEAPVSGGVALPVLQPTARGSAVRDIWAWPTRRWLAAVVGAGITAAAVGLPTALVPSSMFTRMTPVTWWSWPVWSLTAALGGLVAATYVRSADPGGHGGGAGACGGLLSALAVGCPVCNKLIVAVLGATGAMQWWAPLQPLLGVVSMALLAWALRTRLRGERACRAPAPSPPDGETIRRTAAHSAPR